MHMLGVVHLWRGAAAEAGCAPRSAERKLSWSATNQQSSHLRAGCACSQRGQNNICLIHAMQEVSIIAIKQLAT